MNLPHLMYSSLMLSEHYYLANLVKINTQKAVCKESCLQKQNDNGQLSSVFLSKICTAKMPDCGNSYFAVVVFTVEYISFFFGNPLMYAHSKHIFHHHLPSPHLHLTNKPWVFWQVEFLCIFRQLNLNS